VEEELVAWLSATLDDRSRRAAERHLSRCPKCAGTLAVLARALSGRRDLPSSPAAYLSAGCGRN
jgi:anti-sigma factor RsiW